MFTVMLIIHIRKNLSIEDFLNFQLCKSMSQYFFQNIFIYSRKKYKIKKLWKFFEKLQSTRSHNIINRTSMFFGIKFLNILLNLSFLSNIRISIKVLLCDRFQKYCIRFNYKKLFSWSTDSFAWLWILFFTNFCNFFNVIFIKIKYFEIFNGIFLFFILTGFVAVFLKWRKTYIRFKLLDKFLNMNITTILRKLFLTISFHAWYHQVLSF